MKKSLLVLSDIHGSTANLASVLSWAKGLAFGAAVFLGDGLSDLERTRAKIGCVYPWQRVRGNNDPDTSFPESVVFDFGGHRFFLCHGHRHNLYTGMDALAAAARGNGATAALFGHTHIPFRDERDGLLLVNPGSLGNPRSRAGATFAVIECNPGVPPKPEFWGVGFDGNITATFVGNSL